MAATIWKGALSFGLVHIPVTLHSAVREDKVSFRQIEEDTGCQVKYKRICKDSGKEVPWEKIKKGYEYEKGKILPLTDEDFDKAKLATSKSFEIEDFVKEEDVDPRYFEKPYYLVPQKGGDKAYVLLRESMKETGTIGIGRVTLREKQYLAAIKPLGDAIVLDLLRFASEVVDPGELRFPEEADLKPQELKMAKSLIENLLGEFEPERYPNQYKINIEKIIQGKLKGKNVNLKEAEEPEVTGVIDLMARLEESLKSGGGKAKKTTKPKKSSSAKKSAAKKSSSSSKRKSA